MGTLSKNCAIRYFLVHAPGIVSGSRLVIGDEAIKSITMCRVCAKTVNIEKIVFLFLAICFDSKAALFLRTYTCIYMYV